MSESIRKSTAKATNAQAKPKGKHPGGRPSSYDPKKTPGIAEAACKEFGADDAGLAKLFGVTVTTIHNWKNAHPEFLDALKRGKDSFDTERVERSLVERAIGYSHPDVHISNYQGEITVTPITKHYPPDPTSMIFWLKNRNKDRWRDKVDVDHGVQEDNPLADMMRQVCGATLKPANGDKG